MTMKKTGRSVNNQLRGLKNRAEGKDFEERIDKSFAYYRATGYAMVDKTPEPTKVIKRLDGGKFIAVFSSKAQPDYKGTRNGGRSVMFEAKYTSGDRIADNRVTETQWKYLSQAADLGAHCYVLAGFSSGNVYKIPWEIWRDMKAYFGRKYIKDTDPQLQQYKLKTSWHGLLEIF